MRQEGSAEPERAPRSEAARAPAPTSEGRIVFLGTSLTAGYGLADQTTRFTDRVQARIDVANLPFQVINAGVSGDTSAGGLRRIGWLLRAPIRVLVIELGGNDGLRGLPTDDLRRNLQAVMDSTRAHYPDARLVLAGMEAPPNLGSVYASEFRSVFTALARDNDLTLIPFLLEGVAGDPELNQVDGIHPTAEGHRRVAETIWTSLRPLLEEITPTVEQRQ